MVVLPPGFIDALRAAAFGAATVVLTAASFDQASTGRGGRGTGFFVSGALVSVAATIVFSSRSAHALLQGAASTGASKDHAAKLAQQRIAGRVAKDTGGGSLLEYGGGDAYRPFAAR